MPTLGFNATIETCVHAVAGLARLPASIALCVCLAGCPQTYYNEVREGRLATDLGAPGTKIVFGLDASHGPLNVELQLNDPAGADKSRCGVARAKTPDGSEGTTYFVFDVPAGTYDAIFPEGSSQASSQPGFVAETGKQVYIGTFTLGVVEDWQPPFNFAPGEQQIALDRDLDAAKAALGSRAMGLQLAELTATAPPMVLGGICA
ncbi:MAG: hypothetical protein ABL866_16280 [Devosia sp.]